MPRKRRKFYTHSHMSISNNPDDLLIDTTGEERFKVFEVCTRMCKYTVSLLIASAALSTFMLLQCLIGVQMFSSPQMTLFTITAIGLIGIINLICGLLLLATE
ncbi:MAG: hypothetical protein ACPLKQ_05715 [Candidatus Bathyarchaeales archaeon]